MGHFVISDTNPNDVTGGGGCACSPEKQPDCTPPYAVFYGNDMESPLSPHVVICQRCADEASAWMNDSNKILSAGEREPLLDTAESVNADVVYDDAVETLEDEGGLVITDADVDDDDYIPEI